MPEYRPWTERLTPFDLFEEKRRITWIWRGTAIASVWLIGLGYLLYPFAVKVQQDKPAELSKPTLIVAVALVLLGHIIEGFAVSRQRSILFFVEDLFTPIVQVTFLVGVIAPIFHITFRDRHTIAIPALFIVSGISLLLHAPFLVLMNRRIGQIEQSDAARRQRVAFSPALPLPIRFDSQKSGSANSFGSRSLSVKRTPLLADDALQLPEDEAQRQQLLKLLLKKEAESRPPVVTGPQGGGVQTTYRVDIPVPDDSESVRNRHMSVPTSVGHKNGFATYSSAGNDEIHGSTWQPGDSLRPVPYQTVGAYGSGSGRQQSNISPSQTTASDEQHSASFLSTGSTDEAGTQIYREDVDKQSPWTNQHHKLRPTPSQVDRERRRREIELGDTSQLTSNAVNSLSENPRDTKITWKQRFG